MDVREFETQSEWIEELQRRRQLDIDDANALIAMLAERAQVVRWETR